MKLRTIEKKIEMIRILERDLLDAEKRKKSAKNSIELEMIERWIDGIHEQLAMYKTNFKIYRVK